MAPAGTDGLPLPPPAPATRPAAPREGWPAADAPHHGVTDHGFAWTQAHGRPFVPLAPASVDAEAFRRHWRHCRAQGWLPLFMAEDVAAVVTARPFRARLRREVGKLLRCELYWAGCTEADFDRTLALLGAPAAVEVLPPPVVIPPAWDLAPEAGAPDPYRRGVVGLLRVAWQLGASDIFFDDEGVRIAVRFRLSGVAEVFPPVPARHRSTFLGALKRLAAVSANARYAFHDARFSLDLGGGARVDFRAAFAPTLGGETVGLRLQDSRRLVAAGAGLPLPPGLAPAFRAALGKQGGMILVTGPTGSGKTTTLYSALLSLDRADLVIRTIEDPVEYTLPGITQIPVGADTGRTFAGALRALLRLNPDVILVGEIRDEETAMLALEAGLTGHTLLSTLHAADCTGTITRYLDLIKATDARSALAATLGLILSQRLAPRLCPRCREPRRLRAAEAGLFARFALAPPAGVFRRRGCPECGTGVRGRVPIFEQLLPTPRLRDIIAGGKNFSSQEFRRQWLAEGGRALGHGALELAAAGIIEFEEAQRHAVWVPEAP